ncbi:glycosyltransferase family 4 protein [Propionivibrio dicarboxylicus]|uniref:Glycosyl transferases group 1 n=1 Tax=Propionivibrio dicarboxylicus TaxID=83767 RepID=A0A1G8DUW2_9RHOO|nr:glycosyltransferase family 4 protein [Propionivibrio dicarboxylicus]SDH61482.1 hypothetical protein SAMN05660652_01953 [Propionivibrio dicarboxylicus]
MITANLFHIKATNGLFFYGLDYLNENVDLVRTILVRPSLEKRVKMAFPNTEVVGCSVMEYLRRLRISNRRGDLLYTPTSHPIPFFDTQLIILHDAYPFEIGELARFKKCLLRWSLLLSNCRIGYINRSDAMPFIADLGIPDHRMFFAPNRFPAPAAIDLVGRKLDGVTCVGLLGTDSSKKNYERLFEAVRRAVLSQNLVFRVYGHLTDYFSYICKLFPDLRIELVKSDDVTLNDFMNCVDVLASAAEQEGFGRPIASALLAKMPVELLDRPVFREFFTGGARFHPDIDALVQSLPRHGDEGSPFQYSPPRDVVAAYASANDEIRRLGSSIDLS